MVAPGLIGGGSLEPLEAGDVGLGLCGRRHEEIGSRYLSETEREKEEERDFGILAEAPVV